MIGLFPHMHVYIRMNVFFLFGILVVSFSLPFEEWECGVFLIFPIALLLLSCIVL